MLRILFSAQCDVCGDFYERLEVASTANQNECALHAASIIETAGLDGWFFNAKTRQFWCSDCIESHADNGDLPPVSQLKLPGLSWY
jgi:hypothetical protein